MSKYKYDKDYFNKIDSEEKAYWLGFLYADGCITRFYKNDILKSMTLELTLQKDDEQHLQKFINALKSNVPIHPRNIVTPQKKYYASRVTISNTKLCKDLCDLGCTPCKTYHVRLPDFNKCPDKYMKYFIRGFFDGDGCIHNKKNQRGLVVTFAGMEDMLKDIIDYLIKNKIIYVKPKIYKDKRSNACSFFIYGDDNTRDFLDYIYKDANVYLDRKYQKYYNYFKNIPEKTRYGVYYNKQTNKFIATISYNNKRKRLGQYDDIDEAIKARKEAEYQKMLKADLNSDI